MKINPVLCYCCHAVRCCEGCCRTCKSKCSLEHECEQSRMTETQGWEWYYNVSRILNTPMVTDTIPNGIKKAVAKLTKKPVELTFDF